MHKIEFTKQYDVALAPTLNEHWYEVMQGKKNLGYFPSATTILNAYPQAAHLNKWIGENGWNESQRILKAAGERGTKVHDAIEHLLEGENLWANNYSLDEWSRVCAFVDWYLEAKPEVLGVEVALFSKKHGYAGRVDLVAIIEGLVTVVDFKTSGSMYPHFPLQFAAYAEALEETTDLKVDRTAGLQLGTRTKKNWKFDVHNDWRKDFKMFKTVKQIWEFDRTGGNHKKKIEAPVLILPNNLMLN